MKLSSLFGMIPFELERAVCARLNYVVGRRPSSAPFLSGDSYRALADAIYDDSGSCIPASIFPLSVVFVNSSRLRDFATSVLPKVKEPFILVSHQGDANIDEGYADLAEHPMIAHWFAQNCVLTHPKLTPIPIGLEDRWRHNNGELSDFRRLSRGKKPSLPRIAYAFNLGTNLDERIAWYKALKKVGTARELQQPLNASLYRNTARDYMFVASPPGNGLDCHRTWEAMYMSSVPIVEDNPMNRFFKAEGLPLLILKSWDELRGWSEDDVAERYEAIMREAKLEARFLQHWQAKIDAFRGQAKA